MGLAGNLALKKLLKRLSKKDLGHVIEFANKELAKRDK